MKLTKKRPRKVLCHVINKHYLKHWYGVVFNSITGGNALDTHVFGRSVKCMHGHRLLNSKTLLDSTQLLFSTIYITNLKCDVLFVICCCFVICNKIWLLLKVMYWYQLVTALFVVYIIVQLLKGKCYSTASLEGKTIIVTGANTGMSTVSHQFQYRYKNVCQHS